MTGGLLGSGAIGEWSNIIEKLVLDSQTPSTYDLTSDSSVPVAFGGVVNASVVIIFADQPLTVLLTYQGGTQQTIIVNPMLFLITENIAPGKPITAVSIQRSPGVETNVSAFVGELAS